MEQPVLEPAPMWDAGAVVRSLVGYDTAEAPRNVPADLRREPQSPLSAVSMEKHHLVVNWEGEIRLLMLGTITEPNLQMYSRAAACLLLPPQKQQRGE